MPVDDPRFEELFAGEYYRIVASVALVTGDRDVAGEAVAEAMARAWAQMRKGKEIENLPAWIRTVALNVARGSFRKRLAERRARAALEAAAVDPAEPVSEDASDVRQVLAKLSRREREVVVLRYFEDLSLVEVADELGIAVGTVKVNLKRARVKLAAIMRSNEFEMVFPETRP